MKAIEPVQIWANGSVQTGNWIDAYIEKDNLKDWARFYWAIYTSDIEPVLISDGNLTINEPDYSIWDSTADINQSAYEWICDQLSLTLIP